MIQYLKSGRLRFRQRSMSTRCNIVIIINRLEALIYLTDYISLHVTKCPEDKEKLLINVFNKITKHIR